MGTDLWGTTAIVGVGGAGKAAGQPDDCYPIVRVVRVGVRHRYLFSAMFFCRNSAWRSESAMTCGSR